MADEDASLSTLNLSPEAQHKLAIRENHCFGCGPENPEGLHLRFEVDRDHPEGLRVTASTIMTRMHEGAPGLVHGGIVATLLDEAMAKLNYPLNLVAVTRSLSVDYLKPVPLGVPIHLVARHVSKTGRRLLYTATLSDEAGTVLAQSEGLFVVINPEALTG